MDGINKGQELYYAQIMERFGYYNVIDLKVRSIGDNWLVAIEKNSPKAYCFNEHDFGEILFTDRLEALNKVKVAEGKQQPIISTEEDDIESELLSKLSDENE